METWKYISLNYITTKLYVKRQDTDYTQANDCNIMLQATKFDVYLSRIYY